MQVIQLLKYQQEDSKLLRIEREAANSEERKNYTQAKNFLTKAPEKLEALDARACELGTLVEKLNKQYGEIAETLVDFENLDELVDGGADISFYKKNVLQITEKLKSIKAEIASLTKAINAADEEYKALKKKTISVQKQYVEYQNVYKLYRQKKSEEMDAVKRELEKISKDIDKEVLEKYTAKRNERIFPIICPVKPSGKDLRCSICGMDLSLAGRERVSSGGVTECENCHRFLYLEK